MTEPAKTPEKHNPAGEEELKRMEQEVPMNDQDIYSQFDEAQSTLPQVFGGLLGLQNKDPLSIIERTNLPKEDRRVIIDLIRQAEHGIGAPKALDRPVPYIAKVIINDMRARVSVTSDAGHGMSRQEVVDALTAWSRTLEAREAQQKQQAKAQGVAG